MKQMYNNILFELLLNVWNLFISDLVTVRYLPKDLGFQTCHHGFIHHDTGTTVNLPYGWY